MSKLEISTATLQSMVSKAVKGAGNNKLIPLTGLIEIQLEKKVLTLTTTDATNYLFVKEEKVSGDDFFVTVAIDTFSKLISRMTSDKCSLELKESSLEVKGNGTYNIELPLDEEGKLIKFPNPVEKMGKLPKKPTTKIQLATIISIINSVKPSLADTMDTPCYTGYYVGDEVVATDTYKIAAMKLNLLGSNHLISREMMELLSVMTEDTIDVYIVDNTMLFTTKNCIVYGTELDGIDDYAIDAINGLVETTFGSMCKVSKTVLTALLDRLSLFVGTYDKNSITLTFTKQGMMVSSKASTGTELLPYIESKKFKDFVCSIDIEMLSAQVKAQTTDNIELWYGENNAIKFVDGNVTQIVALLEDETN